MCIILKCVKRHFSINTFLLSLFHPSLFSFILISLYKITDSKISLSRCVSYYMIELKALIERLCWWIFALLKYPSILHLIYTNKSVYWVLNMVLIYGLVLILLTKFVPNSTIRRCSSGTNIAKLSPKILQICPK